MADKCRECGEEFKIGDQLRDSTIHLSCWHVEGKCVACGINDVSKPEQVCKSCSEKHNFI